MLHIAVTAVIAAIVAIVPAGVAMKATRAIRVTLLIHPVHTAHTHPVTAVMRLEATAVTAPLLIIQEAETEVPEQGINLRQQPIIMI